MGTLALQEDTNELYVLTATTPTWMGLARKGDSVVVVDPRGGGDYVLLSDALSAVDDASVNNQYTVLVTGPVFETVTINARSYVHVLFLPGASVTITLASGNGISFTSLSATSWVALDNAAATVRLEGTTAGSVVYTTGCAEDVGLNRLRLLNNASGGGGSLINAAGSTPSVVDTVVGDVTTYGASGSVVTGPYATAHGDRHQVAGAYALAIGEYGDASRYGQRSHAGGEFFGTGRPGEAQEFTLLLGGVSSDTTPVELLLKDGSRAVLPNLCTGTFWGHAVARNAVASDESAGYEFKGVIDRQGSAGSTALVGTVTMTVLGEDVGAWDLTIAADATNGALKFEGVGDTGDEVHWVVTLHVLQTLIATV